MWRRTWPHGHWVDWTCVYNWALTVWMLLYFFIPNHVTKVLPVNLINCEMFHQVFLLFIYFISGFHDFSSFFAGPVPTFLKCVAGIKLKLNFPKTIKNSHFQHLTSCLYVFFFQLNMCFSVLHIITFDLFIYFFIIYFTQRANVFFFFFGDRLVHL